MRLWLLIGVVLFAAIARGETVKLKNGTVLTGSIVQMTETDVTIDTADMGQIVVKRRAVEGFSDAMPAAVAAQPVAGAPVGPAALPAAGININNNNNNNLNNNVPTTAAASAAPAAPAAPVPAAPVAAAAAATMAVEASAADGTGLVLGGLGVGVATHRFFDEGTYDTDEWKQVDPFVRWDVLGYRGSGGFGLTLFLEGTHSKEHLTWMSGGIRGDYSFLKHRTRSGFGSFRIGAGPAYTALRLASADSSDETRSGSTEVLVPGPEPSGSVLVPSDGGEASTASTASARLGGTRTGDVYTTPAMVGLVGYQFLSDGGFGVGVDLSGMAARIGEGQEAIQTLGVSFGLTYAL